MFWNAGKTDPVEIAEAFSGARGLEVITRYTAFLNMPLSDAAPRERHEWFAYICVYRTVTMPPQRLYRRHEVELLPQT